MQSQLNVCLQGLFLTFITLPAAENFSRGLISVFRRLQQQRSPQRDVQSFTVAHTKSLVLGPHHANQPPTVWNR